MLANWQFFPNWKDYRIASLWQQKQWVNSLPKTRITASKWACPQGQRHKGNYKVKHLSHQHNSRLSLANGLRPLLISKILLQNCQWFVLQMAPSLQAWRRHQGDCFPKLEDVMQNTCLHCLHFFGLAGTVACFAVLHIRKHLECDKETPSHTIAYIYIYRICICKWFYSCKFACSLQIP